MPQPGHIQYTLLEMKFDEIRRQKEQKISSVTENERRLNIFKFLYEYGSKQMSMYGGKQKKKKKKEK